MTLDPADVKLAALALFEACYLGNDVNRRAITREMSDVEIVAGLMGLVSAFASQTAAVYGIKVTDLIENYRAAFLLEQAGAI